jgi:type VI secretion system protein ImpA
MSDETDAALPPVDVDDPCGPDLDAEGDSEFMNYLLATEALLPPDGGYFAFKEGDENEPISIRLIDFPKVFKAGDALLARTHDVRLLTLLAKLSILNRDLAGFAARIATIAWLLTDHWSDAHPRGEDGDYIARMQQLAALEDTPVVLLPLQDAPLISAQREGVATFRAQRIALGEINPREKERAWTPAAIEKIVDKAELDEIRRTSATLLAIRSALQRIKAASIEKAGADQAIAFDRLDPLLGRMIDFVHAALVRRDPNVAPLEAPADVEEANQSAGPAPPGGALASLADCDAALAAALGYFAASEPSSPAVLLIGQARALLGRNLYEVMKILAPSHADSARIFVGGEPTFNVPISNMPYMDSGEPEAFEIAPAPSRNAALALLDQVAAHLRRVEPSSPVPHLLDRVKALAARDFLSLLKDLLPEDALSQLKGWN